MAIGGPKINTISEFTVPAGAAARLSGVSDVSGPMTQDEVRRQNAFGRQPTQRRVAITPNAPHTEQMRASSIRLVSQANAGASVSARFDDGEAMLIPIGETLSPGFQFHRVELSADQATDAVFQFGFSV